MPKANEEWKLDGLGAILRILKIVVCLSLQCLSLSLHVAPATAFGSGSLALNEKSFIPSRLHILRLASSGVYADPEGPRPSGTFARSGGNPAGGEVKEGALYV